GAPGVPRAGQRAGQAPSHERPRILAAGADALVLVRGCRTALARAARGSRELREEGGLQRTQPDVRLSRRHGACRSNVASGAGGTAAFRAGAEAHAGAAGAVPASVAFALRGRLACGARAQRAATADRFVVVRS